MKHTILVALQSEAAAMDSAVKAALDKLCTEENIAAIVEREARAHIEAALKEEVKNFFSWTNNGRLAIREAVHEHLARQFPDKT